MSGRSRKKARAGGGRPWYESGWLSGLLLVAVGAYLGVALSGGTGPWWGIVAGDTDGPWLRPGNPGGPVGAAGSLALHLVFGGIWCWGFPLLLVALGLGFLAGRPAVVRPWLLRALPLWLVTGAFLAQPRGLLPEPAGAALGGIVGFTLAQGFAQLFGLTGMRIFLGVFLLVAVIAVLRPWLGWLPGFVAGLGRALAAAG
ncbi:MAG: hypothetical protein IH621_00805, partial [Krumholzibacteria bacterium]|nr:hypothetical protein [Candidatus Krumholzibacteria bacterium]